MQIKIQKYKQITLISLLTLLILLSMLLYSFNTLISIHKPLISEETPKKAGYWDLTGTPIVIITDSQWSSKYSSQPWFSGSGTKLDPYVIENVTINGQGSGNCISIDTSTVYYTIRNCTLFNSGTATNNGGISISNAPNGLIIGNNLSNNLENGIWVYNSQNITILNNTFSYNTITGIYVRNSNSIGIEGNNVSYTTTADGMYFMNSNNVNITKNIVNNNFQAGIELNGQIGYCHTYKIYDNELKNNADGIFLTKGDNNEIFNNVINNTTSGIAFSNSDNNNISGNFISNCSDKGLYPYTTSLNNLFYNNYLSDNNINAEDGGTGNDWNTTIVGNYWDDYGGSDLDDDGIGDTPHDVPGTAGSKDYFPIWDDGPEPIYIDGDATGVGAHNWTWAENQPWCSGLGTFASPYVIEGINIDGNGNGFCISIQNSDVYFEIRNCDLYNAGFTFPDSAVLLNNVGNATIIGNDLIDTNFVGIYMDNSDNNYIIGNNASFADLGILTTNSEFNHIIGNTVNDNLENSINIDDNSNNNTITGNTANGNGYAISIYSDSNNNTIEYNTLINNNVGISILDHCDNNRVFNNYLEDNDIGVAIHNFNSTNNIIYNNTFLLNTVNGEDDSFNVNYWNYGLIGNNWDNYGGIDINDDGIGDTAYTVSGLRGRLDNYPIWDDGDDINPTISINSPSGGSLFGTVAPIYNVDIFDLTLNMSWYTLNGTATQYFFTPTNGINVVAINEIGWDTFSTGSILLTFYVNDSGANPASVSNLIVKDATNPTIVLNLPLGGTTFGSDAPEFNLTIYDLNLQDAWYTLGSSTTIYSISPSNGINIIPILENNWDALPEGIVAINFYVNDTVGNTYTIQVIINKDLPSSDPEPAIAFGNSYLLFLGISIATIIIVERKKRKK